MVCYTADPSGAGLQVRAGVDYSDVQHLIGINSLAASTACQMPMFLDDWSPLLNLSSAGADAGDDAIDVSAAAQKQFDKAVELRMVMVTRLRQVSKDIRSRNQQREHPYLEFDPVYFECSVNL